MTDLAFRQKTLDENFVDWECEAFGFGYGSGEEHTLGALRDFFEALHADDDGRRRLYDYGDLESALGPRVAWLMINLLCHQDIIEYGTSPRFGWLTTEGERLRDYVLGKSLNDLIFLCTACGDGSDVCSPTACNCGPHGYVEGRQCPNPFWRGRVP